MFSILAALVTLGGLVIAQGYVTLPFTKETLDADLSENTPLHRRLISGDVENQITQYTVSFSLGDGQNQKCAIDTSYSDIWVYNSRTPAAFGYDINSADEYVSDNFQYYFPDGTKARGHYYKDQLTFDGVTVDATFAVVDTYDTRWGSFGLGPRATRSSRTDLGQEETSYPYMLKNAGHIDAAAYSLILTTRNFGNGILLLGAVDTSLYTGKLQLLDSQANDTFAVQFSVDGTTLVGELDTASTYTFLPDDIVNRLAASVGGRFDFAREAYLVDNFPDDLNLTFNFSGTEVSVSSTELLTPIINNSKSTFLLTVKPASRSNGKVILGDSFLRSAYTVYDLENNQVAIAQAAESSVHTYKRITSAGIPGASY